MDLMTEITMSALGEGFEERLSGGDIATLPAGEVVLIVAGADDRPIRLDGRIRAFRQTAGGKILSLRLERSTGFHHLHVPPDFDAWFATEDAKLGLRGIEEMLNYLRTQGLGWTGQLIFSDGSILRDPHVVYGWLDQNADRVIAAAVGIVAAPRVRSSRVARIQSHSAGKVHLAKTLALVRRRPSEYLEQHEEGPFVLGQRNFMPRKIVALRQRITLDTMPHRRLTFLLNAITSLAGQVRTEVPSPERSRCDEWRSAVATLWSTPWLVALRRSPAYVGPPLTEETTDPHYRTSYESARSLDVLGWNPTMRPLPRHSFVRYSDEIYQEFVARVVAAAMDMTEVLPRQTDAPAFRGDTWQLYLNVVPPKDVIRTWRSYSGMPDNYRPDVLLYAPNRAVVLLGDAKYRRSGLRASESSRRDLLSYMAAFDVRTALIFFPGPVGGALNVFSVEAQGRALIEVTVHPAEGLEAFLRERMAALLAAHSQIPSWSG